MGKVIKDIKRSWRRGRDWSKVLGAYKLDDGFNEDDTDTEYYKRSVSYIKDHPEGRWGAETVPGFIAEHIAETIPRKRKTIKSKSKRKVINKPKRCKCK